ncbi:MAG: undecaprenyl-diphosphate phosphatase [Firmicutes bacterium]|nr:undecaprenyl-diphosphate phosphatase [Bacillota bacterium]
MSIIEALILGIVQGLTEFLPVSSSGHLVLLSEFFGIEEGVLLFSIAVHLGTLLAVCIVFRDSIIWLIKNPLSARAVLLYVATIPTLVIALVVRVFVPGLLGAGGVPYFFLVTAVLLVVTERVVKKVSSGLEKGVEYNASVSGASVSGGATDTSQKDLRDTGNTNDTKQISVKSAIVVGIAQGIAVLPGISRSGATISAGLIMGESREEMARFSFLLSIPIILVSFVYEILGAGGVLVAEFLLPALVGITAAFVSGMFAIKVMLRLVKKANFSIFAVYLIFVAVLLLLWQNR